MKALITMENPTLEIDELFIFQSILNDADETLIPTVINGNYYHFKKGNDNKWSAIGLPDIIIAFVRVIIERYDFKSGHSLYFDGLPEWLITDTTSTIKNQY